MVVGRTVESTARAHLLPLPSLLTPSPTLPFFRPFLLVSQSTSPIIPSDPTDHSFVLPCSLAMLGAPPLPHLLCSHLQNVAAKRIHMTSIPYTKMNLGIAGVMLRQGLISNLTR